MADLIRVLTFNVLDRGQAEGARRQDVIRRGLSELGPDIVALQEVTCSTDPHQAAELLGEGWQIIDHPSPSSNGVGACLATRWPVRDVEVLDQQVIPDATGLPWAATVAVEVDASAPLGPLLVVHHKPNWQLDREHVREQQALAAGRFVAELLIDRPQLPVVLLGDFDAGPDAGSIRFLTGLQSLDGVAVRYDDAWDMTHPDQPGHTFTPLNPLVRAGEMPLERGRRIDYIMIGCGAHGPLLDVVDCGVVFDQPVSGYWASDHFGVIADLAAPAHPPGAWR